MTPMEAMEIISGALNFLYEELEEEDFEIYEKAESILYNFVKEYSKEEK